MGSKLLWGTATLFSGETEKDGVCLASAEPQRG
jgi:hypothetical protein